MVGELILASGDTIQGYIDGERAKLGQLVASIGATVSYFEDDFLSFLKAQSRNPDGVDAIAIGIGDNALRHERMRNLPALDLPTLIHPTASVSPSARLGRGTVVFPHAVVNSGASIDEGVIINSGAIVEHDCILAAAVHVSPGAVLCGGVQVGERTWIGAGATVIHGVRIGRDTVVGAGATVVGDLGNALTVVGNPARALPRQTQGY